jgi:hypothetical protein
LEKTSSTGIALLDRLFGVKKINEERNREKEKEE